MGNNGVEEERGEESERINENKKRGNGEVKICN